MKKMVLMLALLVLSGCTTLKVVRDDTLDSGYTIDYVKSYILGEKKTTFVGDPIVMWTEKIIKPSNPKMYVSKSDFELKGLYLGKGLSRENIQLKANKAEEFYYFGTTNVKGIDYSVIGINSDNDDNDYHLLITNNGTLNRNTIVDNELNDSLTTETPYSLPEDIIFLKKEAIDMTAGISREIIFGGVNDITLNATYREYTPNDTAHQAFYQNLVYQTSADTIRFRGFKIKVHEVTNEKITFTVVEDGLSNQKP